MTQQYDYLATTMEGLEGVLSAELEAMGAVIVNRGRRAVFFNATRNQLYLLNVSLRTALHVLKPVGRFKAADAEQLYKGIIDMPWHSMFGVDKTFAITSVVHSAAFPHSGFVALKVKDAIADRFVKEFGHRPDVDTRQPMVRIFVHIHDDSVTVSLDASGKSLHKRGYRSMDHPAPLNEILAAGILLLAGYDGSRPFYDPMCGSGTLVTEALMIAAGFPPNLDRNEYCFRHWADYDEDTFESALKIARGGIKKPEHFLFGSDIHPKSVRTTQHHISKLPFFKMVKLKEGNFYKILPPVSKGLLIVNPPYGERLQINHAVSFYERLSKRLFLDYPAWDRWVFSSNTEALQKMRLRVGEVLDLKNGDLPCKLIHFPPSEPQKQTPEKKPVTKKSGNARSGAHIRRTDPKSGSPKRSKPGTATPRKNDKKDSRK